MTTRKWIIGIILFVTLPMVVFISIKIIYDWGDTKSKTGLISVCQAASVAEVLSENFHDVKRMYEENRTDLLIEVFNRKVSKECPGKLLKSDGEAIINFSGVAIEFHFLDDKAVICTGSSIGDARDSIFNINFYVSQGKVLPTERCVLRGQMLGLETN